MIDVIGKYTRNEEIVAWQISDDGVEYNIAYKAPYHQMMFMIMIESGFKFNDYYGNITMPNGMNINDVPESRDYLSEDELISLLDSIEVGMVDETEVVRYMDKNVKLDYIELPKPDKYEINTRQEFIDYIKGIKQGKGLGISKFTYININSVTNPDALFTLEEIADMSSEVRVLYSSLFNNFSMSTEGDVKKLKEVYDIDDSDGALDIQTKFLNEFYKYGIPGLNANILSIKTEEHPNTPYYNLERSLNSCAKLKYGLLEKDTNKFYSVDCNGVDYYDLDNADDFDTAAFIGDECLTNAKREDVSQGYKLIPYGDKTAPVRIRFELISNEGVRALYLSDCDEAHLYRGASQLTSTLDLFKFRTLDSKIIKLSDIFVNGPNYIYEYNIIHSFVKDQIKSIIKKPKYSTTFELMSGIGIAPYYIPMLCAKFIGEGVDTSIDIKDKAKFRNMYYRCSERIIKGFSDKILDKYGVNDPDILDKSIFEQVDSLNEYIEELSEQGKYLVKPVLASGESSFMNREFVEWNEEFADNEINDVNFVRSILIGEQNVGELASGIRVDNAVSDSYVFYATFAAYKAAKANSNGIINMGEFLTSEVFNYLETSKLFKPRTRMFTGCANDMTRYRNDMAQSAKSLIYVTKVFRENSNAKLEDTTRHYAFECVEYSKVNEGKIIFNSITSQMRSQLSDKGLNTYSYIVDDCAALLLMQIKLDKDLDFKQVDGMYITEIKTLLGNGSTFTFSVKLNDYSIQLLSGSSLYSTKYCTNYDYSENQFSLADMTANIYCVNASINPWQTIPRGNFKIAEYNSIVNYFSREDIIRVFGANKAYVEKVLDTTNGIKVIASLKKSLESSNLFPSMPDIFNTASEKAMKAKNGFYLGYNENETSVDYINRTRNDIATEYVNGRCIKNTVLKADVIYSDFKPFLINDGLFGNPSYYSEVTPQNKMTHISNVLPRVLTSEWVESIGELSNSLYIGEKPLSVVERVKYDAIPLDSKIFNKGLVTSDFSDVGVYVSKHMLCNTTGFKKSIDMLTADDMSILCKNKDAIQIGYNEYILKSMNSLLIVRL